MSIKNVIVVGGGAAGFFAALSAKEHHPNAQVCLLEKSSKLLSKVKVSGGGRCNVTNAETSIPKLSKAYPRGGRLMKKLLGRWNTTDTRDWFESRGVELKVEPDGRMFPITDSSQTIINCLTRACEKEGVEIRTSLGVKRLSRIDEQWELTLADKTTMKASHVVIACGGSPKRSGLDWLEELGHEIVAPLPSLFTFNIPKDPICTLMGLTIPDVRVSIQGTKIMADGPLLITHWGMSGPAVLKCSAFGARELAAKSYDFVAQLNWMNEKNAETVAQLLIDLATSAPKKQLANHRPLKLPARLWIHMLEKLALDASKMWGDLGKKDRNRLVNLLTNDTYHVKGKTTFKEEFVTCGGISLDSIHRQTLESKRCPGIYFAGEVLDIDAITGGYNFQAAWATGYVAGELLNL